MILKVHLLLTCIVVISKKLILFSAPLSKANLIFWCVINEIKKIIYLSCHVSPYIFTKIICDVVVICEFYFVLCFTVVGIFTDVPVKESSAARGSRGDVAVLTCLSELQFIVHGILSSIFPLVLLIK